MSGSCHLDRALHVEIGVECQMFVIVIFFDCGQVLQFGAPGRGASEKVSAVGFCLGSGLFGSCNSD